MLRSSGWERLTESVFLKFQHNHITGVAAFSASGYNVSGYLSQKTVVPQHSDIKLSGVVWLSSQNQMCAEETFPLITQTWPWAAVQHCQKYKGELMLWLVSLWFTSGTCFAHRNVSVLGTIIQWLCMKPSHLFLPVKTKTRQSVFSGHSFFSADSSQTLISGICLLSECSFYGNSISYLPY